MGVLWGGLGRRQSQVPWIQESSHQRSVQGFCGSRIQKEEAGLRQDEIFFFDHQKENQDKTELRLQVPRSVLWMVTWGYPHIWPRGFPQKGDPT